MYRAADTECRQDAHGARQKVTPEFLFHEPCSLLPRCLLHIIAVEAPQVQRRGDPLHRARQSPLDNILAKFRMPMGPVAQVKRQLIR